MLEKFASRSDVPQAELLSGQRLVVETLEQLAERLNDSQKPEAERLNDSHKADRAAAADRFLQRAEKLCTLYVDQRPEEAMMLAGFIARRQRVSEALELMQAKWDACRPDAVAQAVEALISSNTLFPEQNAQVEKILEGALKKFGRPIGLVLVNATFAAQQKRYAEAEKCYKEAIARDPSNGAALNNLAMLFVAQEARLDEGLELINRTIDYWPTTSKLDTRAILYLTNKEPEKALKDMTVVLGDGETAVYLFHLARIYHQMGRRARPSRPWRSARKAGLKESALDLYERPIYKKLRDTLR